jgi:hypothetical protein
MAGATLRVFSFVLVVSLAGCGSGGGGGGGGFGSGDGGTCSGFCAGKCTDTNTDAKNCGSCGTVCMQGMRCSAGKCVFSTCMAATDCDDGISCTLDTCTAGGYCFHQVGPDTGATMCPSGQFCVLGKGCIKGKACGSDADCVDMDPCTVNEHCEAATAICTYEILDKDHDGHPPIVCGGDDCDDSDPDRFPGHPEICDGKDNGCTGMIDVGATCPSMFEACMNGSCQCKPENTCGGTSCLDRDNKNCGTCGNVCGTGSSCMLGKCTCFMGLTSCQSFCTDLARDPMNCGMCGNNCGTGSTCNAGNCMCNFGSVMCNGMCANTKTDVSNCGQCGTVCMPMGNLCVNGVCQLGCNALIACTNACMGNNVCYTGCVNKSSAKAKNEFNTLISCVQNACPGNLMTDPCFDNASMACTMCWQSAQKNGGACFTQLNICLADM